MLHNGLQVDWSVQQMILFISVLKNIFLLLTKNKHMTLANRQLKNIIYLHIKTQDSHLKYPNVQHHTQPASAMNDNDSATLLLHVFYQPRQAYKVQFLQFFAHISPHLSLRHLAQFCSPQTYSKVEVILQMHEFIIHVHARVAIEASYLLFYPINESALYYSGLRRPYKTMPFFVQSLCHSRHNTMSFSIQSYVIFNAKPFHSQFETCLFNFNGGCRTPTN